MDAVIRGISIYFFLLVIIRLSGRRTLGDLTTFDFVLLLILGETTQQALLGDNFSLMNSFLLIVTLIGVDIGMAMLKSLSPRVEQWVDGTPILLVHHGEPIAEVLRKAHVDEQDILAAARELRGVERLEQIKFAVLEANGGITIIPENGL